MFDGCLARPEEISPFLHQKRVIKVRLVGSHFIGLLYHCFGKQLKAENRLCCERKMFQIYANLPMLITNNRSLPLPKKRICERKPVLFSADDFI